MHHAPSDPSLLEGPEGGDFVPHPRMLGEGDGLLPTGPLAGITVPLIRLRKDYYEAMRWDPESGDLSAARAKELGIGELLEGYVS